MRNGLTHAEAGRLGAEKTKETIKLKRLQRIEEYFKSPRLCKQCNAPLDYYKKTNKFCSQSCAATFNNLHNQEKYNKTRKREANCVSCGDSLVNKKGKKYCSIKCQKDFEWKKRKKELVKNPNQFGVRPLKRYLFETRGHQCESCGYSEWLGQPIPIEMDHTDGNHKNNSFDNLKLLCPTCHALTPTYKAKNKGNGRHSRMKRYYEGKSY